MANFSGNTISQYSITSGKLTAMTAPTITTGTNPLSVTISPDGSYVYATNYFDATVSQYMVGSGGALSKLSTATVTTSGAGPLAIAVR